MRGGFSDDIVFFDILARCRSLTEGAREFGVSVSAVSKRLTQIETRLGVPLIQRTTRRLVLTPEGRRYADGAALIAAQLAELEDSLSAEHDELRGRVRMRSTIGLGRTHIAALVAEFVTAHPGLRIDLELSAEPLNIAGTGFDIDIHVGPLHDSRLTTTRLCRNRRVVCAAPEYVRRHGQPGTLAELEQHNCLVLKENDSDYSLWRFAPGGGETAVRVEGNLVSNDGDVITRWCVEGQGLVMRSLWQVGPLLRDGTLVQVLADIPTPSADIFAVYPHALPRRGRAVIEHLKCGLRERIPFAY